jgi:hypothetical protein
MDRSFGGLLSQTAMHTLTWMENLDAAYQKKLGNDEGEKEHVVIHLLCY